MEQFQKNKSLKKHSAIIFYLVYFSMVNICFAQGNTNNQSEEWIKIPATSMYSYDADIKTKNEFIQAERIKIIGNWDSLKVFEGLKSSDIDVRMNSVRILGWIPANDKISELEKLLLIDTSSEVRIMCAKSLALLGSYSAQDALIKTLHDKDKSLVLEAAMALASLGEKEKCLGVFQSLWTNADRRTKLQINLSLLNIANSEAIVFLKTTLNDADPFVSVSAAIVLSEIKQYEFAFPTLKQKLNDPDRYVRMAALRGLAYIGNENSIQLIKGKLSDTDKLVKERSIEILKTSGLN